MTETMTSVVSPYMDAVREALEIVHRLEERVNYGERLARLETRVEELERRLLES